MQAERLGLAKRQRLILAMDKAGTDEGLALKIETLQHKQEERGLTEFDSKRLEEMIAEAERRGIW